ncbi:AsmA family protein [Marinomonas sp. TI.3.20]|uniref:AsmA family protein n=1 Tax=Marinomonas sp. TI.3.20 TaxID=3121296 RepID=UPI00311D8D8C
MTWLKRIGIVIGVLFVLLAAILAYALYFVNSASFKTELQKVALEKADIHLRIDGDIQWSFFPWLGIELDDIGVAMGDDPEILQFDRAEFGLAILPLLKQSIQVDQVRLVNLKANLSVDKSGRGNWQRSFAEPASKNTNKTTPSIANSQTSNAYQATSSGAKKSVIPDIKLDKLQIDNAQVVYRDAKTNQKIDATFNVNLSDVQWNKAWPMVMDAVIKQSDLNGKNALTISSKLTAKLTVFPEREVFSLANMSLSTELQGDALPASPLKANVDIKQVDMDIPQENLFMDGMSLSTLGVNLNAKVKMYQVLSDPQYTASVSVGEFNPRDVLKQLHITIPDMADSSVLSKASGDVKIEGSTDKVVIQPMSLMLDDTNLQANVVAELSPLRWDANITGENLDIDRYLPPPADPKDSKSSAKTVAATPSDSDVTSSGSNDAATADLVPLDLVRSLNGHLGFEFKNLTVKKLQLNSVNLDATMGNGVVHISPAAVSLYKGKSTVDATYDARTNTPTLDVSSRVQGIQIQPLLKDFMDLDKLSGTTSLTGELSAKGNQVDALMSSLNGDFLAEITNGTLNGVNLTKTVCQGIAAIRKESLSGNNFSANTPFESMNFPIHIVNGNVSTPGLVMTSAGVSVTGDGDVSLVNKSLDYQVNVAIAGSELDHACRVDKTLTDLAFPVVCKGKFSDDPAGLCRPDVKGFGHILADLAKAELKEKAKAKVDEEQDKLKEKLKDKLKSLF